MKKPMNSPIAVYLKKRKDRKQMAKLTAVRVALGYRNGMEIKACPPIYCVDWGRSIWPVKRTFYKLINPEREVEEGAAKVHGYTWTS